MTWTIWGWYLLTELVVDLSPGPAVFFVVSQALRGGLRRSLWGALGIISVNVLFFLLSAVGLTAMLVASHELFQVVKWVGAAYLVWVGIQTFRGEGTVALAPTNGPDAGPSGAATYWRGVVLQFANPKAIIFFTALLPQFIRPNEPVFRQMFVLCMTAVVAELIVLFGYGLLAGSLSTIARQPRYAKITNRVSGALLIGAGAGVAFVTER